MYKRSFNDSSYASAINGDYPNKRQQQEHPHQQCNMSSGYRNAKNCENYPLTLTAYKRLTIGIRIGMDSSNVEIAIVDNKGGELIFSMSTWKLVLQNGADILKKLRDNATSPEIHIEIDHLRIEFTRMHNDELVKTTDYRVTLYMTEVTMRKVFAYEQCIDHIFTWLTENMYAVASKYTACVNVLRSATAPTDYVKLITESDHFEQHSLIDCELLALVMQSMLRNVNYVPL